MKLTKLTFITALAVGGLLALSPALQADDATNTPPATPPADGAPHGRQMRGGFDRMVQALNLTDEQKPKVQAIMRDQTQKMRDLRQDTSLSREDRRTKMRTIREDTATQLKAVLTADQFAQWQKMTQQRNRQMRPPSGNGTTNTPAATPPQI